MKKIQKNPSLSKCLAVVVKVAEVRGQESAGSGTLVSILIHENPPGCFSNGFPATGFPILHNWRMAEQFFFIKTRSNSITVNATNPLVETYIQSYGVPAQHR